MRFKNLSIAVFILMIAASCKETKTSENEDAMEETMDKDSMTAITIEKLEGSPAYLDASLEMTAPASTTMSEAGEVDFTFDVKNYELSAQTEGPNAAMLANSDKGQHIHFILDNQPYSAHYEPNFKKEIPEGTHHLVAFLSRSYHESVKNENSVVVKQMKIGDSASNDEGMDMEAPTLIYSRPKGEYSGKDTENLLLDFFVLNTTLSENGSKVRATVNGTEFMLTEWVPYVVKGLPKGEVTIKLELLDANGQLIPGKFNEVTRTVMLKE